MESLPARQPAPRRSSPEQSQPTTSTSTSTSTSSSSSSSPDSHDIFVPKEKQQVRNPSFSEEAPKCWICLLDATEDTSDSSPWRSPCPCALVAHEACLLDWIADIESPSRHATAQPKVLCPQCKSQIRLARPRDPLVSLFQAVERSISYTFPKAALLLIGGVLYGACAAGGIHTIYVVFGAEEGARILAPVRRNAIRAPVDAFIGTPGVAARAVLTTMRDHWAHWRLYIGLPLITPTLILSRTSLADGILPVLPVLFFVTQQTLEGGELLQWPPSAEFAFSVLPYVRGVYNAWYKRTWEARKKGWLDELRPQVGNVEEVTAEPAQPAADNNGHDEAGEEDIVEIHVDGGIFADWDENAEHEAGEDIEDEPPALVAVEEDRLPGDVLDGLPPALQFGAAAAAAPPPQNIPDNRNANHRDVLSISPTGIAQTVLGALIFPTLAGIAGETLKLVLPTSWLKGKGAQKTFLQAKWARTLVGGCLLVLGKDALVLYVRWRMAGMQRGRRVLDYDGQGRGKVA